MITASLEGGQLTAGRIFHLQDWHCLTHGSVSHMKGQSRTEGSMIIMLVSLSFLFSFHHLFTTFALNCLGLPCWATCGQSMLMESTLVHNETGIPMLLSCHENVQKCNRIQLLEKRAYGGWNRTICSENVYEGVPRAKVTDRYFKSKVMK